MITLDIQGFQDLQDELAKELNALKSNKVVTVGIHEEAGDVESGDLTMASLGAINEFGADIKHPGGTSYGYASKGQRPGHCLLADWHHSFRRFAFERSADPHRDSRHANSGRQPFRVGHHRQPLDD
ncbi:hypothetical protein [Pseudomonas syringae]